MINNASKNTSGETESVRLDVGGRTFKVSRSLINQHDTTMLARLVSDTWQSVKDSEKSSNLFIDRDGDRFAYVLDFLRYGRVTLPCHIPRELFLLDLDFFGIEGATDETVVLDHDYFCHSSKVSEMYSLRAKLSAQVKDIDRKLAAITLSSGYFEHYAEKGNLSFSCVVRKGIDDEGEMLHIRRNLYNKTSYEFSLVNVYLKEYGLQLITYSDDYRQGRNVITLQIVA